MYDNLSIVYDKLMDVDYSIYKNIIDERLNSKNNQKIYNVEGLKESNWVLMDLGDVIVNVMTTKDRDYYKLDKFFEKYPLKEV